MKRREGNLLREYKVHYKAIQDELTWRVGMPPHVRNEKRIEKCTEMLYDLKKRIKELEK